MGFGKEFSGLPVCLRRSEHRRPPVHPSRVRRLSEMSFLPRSVATGILSLVLIAAYAGAGAAAETLELEPSEDGVYRGEVILDSYAYRPDEIIVPVGKPVELTLRSV